MTVAPDESYCNIGSSGGHIVHILMRDNELRIVDSIKVHDINVKDEEAHPVESIDIWTGGDMYAAASLSGFCYVYERRKLRLKLLHPDGVNGVKFTPGEKPRVCNYRLAHVLKDI